MKHLANSAFNILRMAWGGLVASAVLLWHAYKCEHLDWCFVTMFLAFLAYHAGIHTYQKFLDHISDVAKAKTP